MIGIGGILIIILITLAVGFVSGIIIIKILTKKQDEETKAIIEKTENNDKNRESAISRAEKALEENQKLLETIRKERGGNSE